jgi:hypothetical protein
VAAAGLRKDFAGGQDSGRRAGEPDAQDAGTDDHSVPGSALKSLRDRLIQRQQR